MESGIPLITAVCNEREQIYHSIIVIGHDERSEEKLKTESLDAMGFEYLGLHLIDSSSLYENYITIDDNQYPYQSEKYDNFSIRKNCKVEAFIVPLYHHILLDAESAINIIEKVYKDNVDLLRKSLQQLVEEESEYEENSIDNPIVLRYYLATARGFISFRNRETEYLEEKLFYDTTPFPKFVWVGEYSTLELYKKEKILGEIVVDATAPKYSGMGAIIAIRFAGRCVSRQTYESPEVLHDKLQDIAMSAELIYNLYTNNLQKGDFEKC